MTKTFVTVRDSGGWLAVCLMGALAAGAVAAPTAALVQGGASTGTDAATPRVTVVLGRPTSSSMDISVLAQVPTEVYADYGTTPGQTIGRTPTMTTQPGEPAELTLGSLRPDTRYFYRVRHRWPGETTFRSEREEMFSTARRSGAAFSFGVQGDSHPEQAGRLFNPDLYARTIAHARREILDFYLMLGDDFSLAPLIERGGLSQSEVDGVYAAQRTFLATLSASTPLYLVNGEQERATLALLDGTPTSPALLAGSSRARLFPLPVPGPFYSGDAERIEPVGLLRDYYAWTWGDALFVVIDPYWHSPVLVDTVVGADARGERDLWDLTIGDVQYAWLKQTLEESRARYKFVFAHHVTGAWQGGIEAAGLHEWGGRSRDGSDQFKARRPTWDLPIHQLMVKAGVTIFFQGHDHLFARQQLDGVVYQTVPSPADATYSAPGRAAYRSGDLLPNSGHLRVNVSTDNVRVDYVRSVLPGHETADLRDGDVSFTYTVVPRR